MTFSVVFTSIIKYLLMIIVPVFASLLTFYLHKLANTLIDKINTQKEIQMNQDDKAYVRGVINSAVSDIEMAVQTVQQTYVSELKEKGAFNKEEQAEALEKAISIAKEELLNQEQKEIIKTEYPNLNAFIRNVIESYLSH